jgi:hypothetical protein
LIKDFPSYGPAFFEMGKLLGSAGKFPQAEYFFKKLVDLEPENIDAHFALG